MLDIDLWGLVLPFAYITVLVGALMSFSNIYRKRKAAESANLAPWFGPHLQRNVYLSLLHMNPENDEKDSKVPVSILRAALLRRAVEDIRRLIQIRTAKQAINNLLQRGSVGDDLNQRFQRAEKEIEEELRDVVMEGNALAPNWGQVIFQSANEIAGNTMLRARIDEIQAAAPAEKEWWGKRRASLREAALADLDDAEHTSSKSASVSDDTVLVDVASPHPPPAASTPSSSKKKKGRK